MKEAEAAYGLKPYFNQIVVGLLWRDYYRFMFKKHGNVFFRSTGFSEDVKRVDLANSEKLERWKTATTGQPLVDALMDELITTGYLNNAARQLVSTYLVHELQVNWRLGAAYFEEKLLDYSPASNWGNWATVAGVGNDERLNKNFDFERQLKIVDPKGNYLQAIRA
jgi:deoxyribodipyrimidine photo-lyase